MLGLGLAAWGRDILVAFSPPAFRVSKIYPSTDGSSCFSLGLSFLTSLLFGLWPAWRTSRADIQLALKAGGHGSSDAPGARRSRDLLVVAEVALTLVLLGCTAGLVLKSFANARDLGLGFDPHLLLSARVDLPEPTYSDRQKLLNFSEALLEKLSTLPGVEKAALASNPPLMTGWQEPRFCPKARRNPSPGKLPSAEMAVVTADYFTTMRTPLLRGRPFEARDTKDVAPVIIIDQLLADRYFPGEDPDREAHPHVHGRGGGEGISNDRRRRPALESLRLRGNHGLAAGVSAHDAKNRKRGWWSCSARPFPKSLEKPVRDIVASLDPRNRHSNSRRCRNGSRKPGPRRV